MNKLFHVVCLLLVLTTTSSLQACNLKKSKVLFTTEFIEETDSIPRNAIPDSIMNIVYESTTIGVSLFKSSMDTIAEVEKNIVLDREHTGALKFAFMLSRIKNANAVPFSLFKPKVSYQFVAGKKTCSMQLDFGTGQIKVTNKDDSKMYFLSDKILLTEATMLFPQDEFLKFMLNNVNE